MQFIWPDEVQESIPGICPVCTHAGPHRPALLLPAAGPNGADWCIVECPDCLSRFSTDRAGADYRGEEIPDPAFLHYYMEQGAGLRSMLEPLGFGQPGERRMLEIGGGFGFPSDYVQTNLRFRPVPAPTVPPPLTLAICAIVKNEGPYLLEWIAHHRLVGVEHFVLFDNGSTDNTSALLSGLAGAGIVDYVPWPDIPHGVPAQRPAYSAGLARLHGRSRWVAFIDADEFLNPLCGRSVPSILTDYDNAAGLVVPWRLFGSNGRQEWEDELLTRRFTRRAAADHPLNGSVKTIVQARLVARADIHTPEISAGSLIDEFGRVAGTRGHPAHHAVPDATKLVINHYFTKSRGEWARKRSRGRATEPDGSAARHRPDEHFTAHDLNDIEDLGLASRAPQIRAEMERLRSLLG